MNIHGKISWNSRQQFSRFLVVEPGVGPGAGANLMKTNNKLAFDIL